MRLNKVSSSNQVKVSKIRTVRKDIARVLTFINTARKEAARVANKKSGWKHLDLRVKKTRAIRRKLSAFQRSK